MRGLSAAGGIADGLTNRAPREHVLIHLDVLVRETAQAENLIGLAAGGLSHTRLIGVSQP